MRRNISPKRLELPESSSSLNLKKYIIYLTLLIPIVGNAQFNISYDVNTNTMSVNYTGCEICLLGNTSAISACECHNDCETSRSIGEELKKYEECISDCDENHQDDPVIHDACLEGCEKYFEEIEAVLAEEIEKCKEDCNEKPKRVWTIIGYAYTLVATWAPIGHDPRLETDNWTQLPVTPLIEGNWVDIPDWNPESPWPEIYAGNNRCWGIGIRIFYEDADGSRWFCDFTQWECEFLG